MIEQLNPIEKKININWAKIYINIQIMKCIL